MELNAVYKKDDGSDNLSCPSPGLSGNSREGSLVDLYIENS